MLQHQSPMLHPIYAALLQRPDLLIGHGLAYADLVTVQARAMHSALQGRLLAAMMALIGAVAFVLFAGTALMLGLMLDRYHPVVLLLPGLCLATALLGALIARRPLPEDTWAPLKTQLEDDLRALRSLG
jgi:hypothetical protein